MPLEAPAPVRIMGATIAGSAVGGSLVRMKGIWDALARRHELVDTIRPEVGGLAHWASVARHVHPHRQAWRHRASLNAARMRRRSSLAERMLAGRAAEYDVLLQWQTVFRIRPSAIGRPLAIYTDNIYALTHRLYPAWSKLSAREARRVLEFEGATLHDADTVFAFSEWLKDGMVDDYGVDPERIHVVGSSGNIALPELDVDRGAAPVAILVGLEYERKGVDVLLEAWPAVRRELPDAELLIVGLPAPGDGDGNGDGVRWPGRIADPAELSRLYSSARVFVLPARFDPRPHVVYEAMAHGLPAIVSDRCAMPEMVSEGETGLVVPAEDPAALAAALTRLLGDRALARQMGDAGRAETERDGGWDAVVARMDPHLRALASAEKTVHPPSKPVPGR